MVRGVVWLGVAWLSLTRLGSAWEWCLVSVVYWCVGV